MDGKFSYYVCKSLLRQLVTFKQCCEEVKAVCGVIEDTLYFSKEIVLKTLQDELPSEVLVTLAILTAHRTFFILRREGYGDYMS